MLHGLPTMFLHQADSLAAEGDDRRKPYAYLNFEPQPRIDIDGKEFPDADLRCQKPDLCIPIAVDFANACYGPEWARCYAGTIEAEESEDEYARGDVEMEESKVGFSDPKGGRQERS